MAEAVKALGYPEAYVFRWQDGVLEGWVEFEADGGPQRHRLDFGNTMGNNRAPMPPAETLSGIVVVAFRKQAGAAEGEYLCSLVQRIIVEVRSGRSAVTLGPLQGKLRREKNGEGAMKDSRVQATGTSVSLSKDVDGKPVPWLELRLVQPGR
jgi:hypothetical protein